MMVLHLFGRTWTLGYFLWYLIRPWKWHEFRDPVSGEFPNPRVIIRILWMLLFTRPSKDGIYRTRFPLS